MARDVRIEARLIRWAQACTVGDGAGYPAMSTLHPNWGRPPTGMRPAPKTASIGSDVMETHEAIGSLSRRERNAVVVHYVMRGAVADQCERLQCAQSTLYARIDSAHRGIADWLDRNHAMRR